jgi:hypothetical protein
MPPYLMMKPVTSNLLFYEFSPIGTGTLSCVARSGLSWFSFLSTEILCGFSV